MDVKLRFHPSDVHGGRSEPFEGGTVPCLDCVCIYAEDNTVREWGEDKPEMLTRALKTLTDMRVQNNVCDKTSRKE